MISDLLPGNVVTVVATPAIAALPLSSTEAATVVNTSATRRSEFQAGRAAARLALAELGIRGHDLLPADDRRPQWPPGIVGAITHTEGFCAAAVARQKSVSGIGIDAERLDRPITGSVRELICHPSELELAQHEPHAAHVIFSAKESFFKAYYPATLHWIDFLDARVTISPTNDTFEIKLVADHAPRPPGFDSLLGRYRVSTDLVVTALAVEASNKQ